MNNSGDVRWKQQFSNFKKALIQLKDAVKIYGSRAKGTYKEGSDIDPTIKGVLLPFSELMQIEDQVDDLYLPYGVDLSQYV